jgi:hypothetical protein
VKCNVISGPDAFGGRHLKAHLALLFHVLRPSSRADDDLTCQTTMMRIVPEHGRHQPYLTAVFDVISFEGSTGAKVVMTAVLHSPDSLPS